MQYTSLFTALSLLATALPHGDHPSSPSMPVHRNTSMSRGYAGYEVSASMPYPKPTGTGTPHPPGCMCSQCRPHGNSTMSGGYGNCTTSTTKVRISTMVDTPAHTSFPAVIPAQSSKTKTVVHTTYVDAPAFTSFTPPVSAATVTSAAMPHHPHARDQVQTLEAASEPSEAPDSPTFDTRAIIAVTMLASMVAMLAGITVLVLCLRWRGKTDAKKEKGKWYGKVAGQ